MANEDRYSLEWMRFNFPIRDGNVTLTLEQFLNNFVFESQNDLDPNPAPGLDYNIPPLEDKRTSLPNWGTFDKGANLSSLDYAVWATSSDTDGPLIDQLFDRLIKTSEGRMILNLDTGVFTKSELPEPIPPADDVGTILRSIGLGINLRRNHRVEGKPSNQFRSWIQMAMTLFNDVVLLEDSEDQPVYLKVSWDANQEFDGIQLAWTPEQLKTTIGSALPPFWYMYNPEMNDLNRRQLLKLFVIYYLISGGNPAHTFGEVSPQHPLGATIVTRYGFESIHYDLETGARPTFQLMAPRFHMYYAVMTIIGSIPLVDLE